MSKRVFVPIVLALLVGLAPILLSAEPASGQAASPTRFVQPGFTDTFVAGVEAPTALAFTPDGQMLVANQQGRLYAFDGTDPGQPARAPTLDISGRICANGERGLLGVAVDPAFRENGYIYLYFTQNNAGVCKNQVSRFVLRGGTVDRSSERVLLRNIYSANNHNAGDVKFGKDGYLYVSVGDGAKPPLARDKSILLGKILRVDRAGGIPPSNPYRGTGTARCNSNGQTSPGLRCQEIFASGLRNPFRMGFNPNASFTSFLINDVGQTKWEEVDRGQAGADYGWDLREGPCTKDSYTNCGAPPRGVTNPIYSYKHTTGCSSITGAAFVPNGAWPSQYNNRYLFGDLVCGRIYGLQLQSNGTYKPSVFAYNMGGGGPIAMAFGPGNALYYTTYAGGVHRIDYTG